MKHNIINALIILVIFALSALFGTLLVESSAQMHHAVSGAYSYNQGGIIFLTIGLTGFALFASYFAIKVRNDDRDLKLKSEQRLKDLLAQMSKA